ncbi:hypothetical protein SE17_00070 [Kouleothrix aurantiaca]|uniref:Uncharacterized protein n=1 Tax=Kouleothrix aurantiaca TaxID=186479 RepID=A0A0P9HJ43_9CHLR|nr:hypothetical protein SE17_00070 [Kouleothrix aurantiaca]
MATRALRLTDQEARDVLAGKQTLILRPVVPTMTAPKVPPIRMQPAWEPGGYQETDEHGRPVWNGFHPDYPYDAKWFTCPWGKDGDRLYGQEAWRCETFPASGSPPLMHFRADRGGEHTAWTQARMWRSATQLRKEDARIWLTIRNVRVKPLCDLSDQACKSAGVKSFLPPVPFPSDWPQNEAGKYLSSYGWEYASDRSGFAQYPQAVLAAAWAARGVAVGAWMWLITVRKDRA